jgi:hypothetical protein
VRRPFPALATVVLVAALTGCGGGASGPAVPTIAPAKKFTISGFEPAASVPAKSPTSLGFTIDQPSGGALTRYKTGAGPHTGIHLIAVTPDLSTIVHTHPAIAPDGHVSEQITFPAGGRWHVVVDAYTNLAGAARNFQLTHDVDVSGPAADAAIPPFAPVVRSGDVVVRLEGAHGLHALQAQTMKVRVTVGGAPAVFTDWLGAEAHAVFFRKGTYAYFHTHVCRAGDTLCQGFSGAVGSSPGPGVMNVAAIFPQTGTWRLFLQFQVGSRVVTAPFTLEVS